VRCWKQQQRQLEVLAAAAAAAAAAPAVIASLEAVTSTLNVQLKTTLLQVQRAKQPEPAAAAAAGAAAARVDEAALCGLMSDLRCAVDSAASAQLLRVLKPSVIALRREQVQLTCLKRFQPPQVFTRIIGRLAGGPLS
jgi:hypothetical protein